jgi:hypothetical protein
MSVQTSTFDAVFGNDPLGRFTAAIVTAVPEFDPGDTPIGHALASEFFQRLEPGAVRVTEPVVPTADSAPTELIPVVAPLEPGETFEADDSVETTHIVLSPERVYDWPAADEPVRRPSPRPRVAPAPMVAQERAEDEPMTEDEVSGTVLELPIGGTSVEWFDATTEPDEEIEEQARRAS